jgi:hypothetical protein
VLAGRQTWRSTAGEHLIRAARAVPTMSSASRAAGSVRSRNSSPSGGRPRETRSHWALMPSGARTPRRCTRRSRLRSRWKPRLLLGRWNHQERCRACGVCRVGPSREPPGGRLADGAVRSCPSGSGPGLASRPDGDALRSEPDRRWRSLLCAYWWPGWQARGPSREVPGRGRLARRPWRAGGHHPPARHLSPSRRLSSGSSGPRARIARRTVASRSRRCGAAPGPNDASSTSREKWSAPPGRYRAAEPAKTSAEAMWPRRQRRPNQHPPPLQTRKHPRPLQSRRPRAPRRDRARRPVHKARPGPPPEARRGRQVQVLPSAPDISHDRTWRDERRPAPLRNCINFVPIRSEAFHLGGSVLEHATRSPEHP